MIQGVRMYCVRSHRRDIAWVGVIRWEYGGNTAFQMFLGVSGEVFDCDGMGKCRRRSRYRHETQYWSRSWVDMRFFRCRKYCSLRVDVIRSGDAGSRFGVIRDICLYTGFLERTVVHFVIRFVFAVKGSFEDAPRFRQRRCWKLGRQRRNGLGVGVFRNLVLHFVWVRKRT